MPHLNVQAKQIECVSQKAGASSHEERICSLWLFVPAFFASQGKVLLFSRIRDLKLY